MPEPGLPNAEGQTTITQPLLERRRPGRVEHTNPHVIALLRDPTALDPDAPPDISGPLQDLGTAGDDLDDLAPAKGILTGLLLALPLWALIGAGAWFLLRG
jgi:hypothetical protein